MSTATPHCKDSRFYKPLILFSSPHEQGNTRKLLDQLLPHLPLEAEPAFISAFGTQIKPCTDCRICLGETCPLNGDGMGEIIKMAEEADLLICASPVYFNGVPAPMKAIIDRSQQLFVRRFIKHDLESTPLKTGILLTVSGSENENAVTGVREVLRMFFACLGARLTAHVSITGTDKIPLQQASPQEIERLLRTLSPKMPEE